MKTLEEKFMENLDKKLKMFLDIDNKLCEEMNNCFRPDGSVDEKKHKIRFDLLFQNRISQSHLMEFANNTIGRTKVNKLCKKYGIRNRY